MDDVKTTHVIDCIHNSHIPSKVKTTVSPWEIKLSKQLKDSSNNENIVKSTAFWLSVWKKWCLEKGIAKEIENYEPSELNTLLKRCYAEIKNKHG